MDLHHRLFIIFAVLITGTFAIHAASAQSCISSTPQTDAQLGCPDPFYATASKPVIGSNIVEFNITVKNRKIDFPPKCVPGECYDNLNYQGLPTCESWSGNLTAVKIALFSCFPYCKLQGCPDCDFNVTVTPTKPQNISNEKSQNYTVRIKAFTTSGDYDFTFAAFLSSEKKSVFDVHVNISDQPTGVEGDNAVCQECGSEKCDSQRTTCEIACAGAAYCAAPGCFFDTSYPEAAQSCCGDDSGEVFKRCSKSPEIDWNCTLQNACCESPGSCVYSGNCYAEDRSYMMAAGEDKYAYCSSGMWHDCDESPGACSGCGFLWNSSTSACCGDDSTEYFRSRICLSGCDTNMTDRTCCPDGGSACVYNGTCYATRDVIALGGKNVTCEGGVWNLKINQSACYKGDCKKNNRCEGACPGCMFKDYSCYGNSSCEPDYMDPDLHWTYCWNCSLNWSYEEKNCCGDDEKEFWVTPCPTANVSSKCCSNPNDRVNSNGECVISCGVAIRSNVTELREESMPFNVSLSPEAMTVVAGKSAGFGITVRTDGTRSLHNVRLNLCGPMIFIASPQSIEELKPGEAMTFAVNFTAPPDSIGTWNFAAYVSSDELVRQAYRAGVIEVTMAEYPPYDVYIVLVSAAVVALIVKKSLSLKGHGPKKKPLKNAEDARRALAELVREELGGGTSEKELRLMIVSRGLKEKDVETAFAAAKKGKK